MAFPSKLTDNLITEFAKLMYTGAPRRTACDTLGVSYTAFNRWMKQGRADRAHAARGVVGRGA